MTNQALESSWLVCTGLQGRLDISEEVDDVVARHLVGYYHPDPRHFNLDRIYDYVELIENRFRNLTAMRNRWRQL